MALSTYSDLQTSVVNWLGRDGDSTITAVVADAIALVEARLNRVLRVAQMEATVTGTSNNGVLALPADFLAWRRIEAYPYGPLSFAALDWAADTYPTGDAGVPSYFTIQGAILTTYPSYTGEVTLDYYQKIPALSDTNVANWLLTEHPDVYLFGTLVELNAFAKNPDAAVLWDQRAKSSVEEIITQDRLKRYSASVSRPKGATP